MTKRNLTQADREQFRENAKKGTAKTRGKPRIKKSKYGVFSWGFNRRGSKTEPRKHDHGRVTSKIFRKNGKHFTLLVRKEEKGRGKKSYIGTVLEHGKTQSSLGRSFKVEADSFPRASEKIAKEFKRQCETHDPLCFIFCFICTAISRQRHSGAIGRVLPAYFWRCGFFNRDDPDGLLPKS